MAAYPTIDFGLLTDFEKAAIVDQGLASLVASIDDLTNESYGGPAGEMSRWLHNACDNWDKFADVLPGFREEER